MTERRTSAVGRFGKEVKVDGERWCDASSDLRAVIIADALEKYFHEPALPLDQTLIQGTRPD